MSINLDNPKTYHQYDLSEAYDVLPKFSRHFEKGVSDGQNIFLNYNPTEYTDFNIITTGKDKHLAEIIYSFSPFFLNIGLHISTTYRLQNHITNNSLLLVLASEPNQSETKSIISEIENKKCQAVYLASSNYQTENQGDITFQSTAHTFGFILGLLTRFNPQAAKAINLSNIYKIIETTSSKLTKDIDTKTNSAKSLAKKHAQKAVLVFSAGHLSGVGKFVSGLITNQSKCFSAAWDFPEVKYLIENMFTYPTRVLSEYQVLLLNSDLFPNNIKSEVSDFKQILSQKRINYTDIKPDSLDWFEQIAESVVFLSYFSYYLSITNKVKI
ncbi:hypothetical protein A2572_04275 [Candidatus Collierbacteria bacterium RIFOXYD1_FULL_40_9]|uniref:Bifunctional glucose-6-phosphate/mannose-6-phosphate isomerase C-terminal domain-containing protein n=1 Tax=Candidatus Collierbacteria bacterium RIFOXYD1_FULL_40_9 TaxID=1817731 RepID=A0A1F5FPN9_9BACT|nr:MAG: hypothetical protein A2572_04275 [Candidatus Collierbacteria bacterium RIFOXYD1_FULL_40_9]